MKLKDFKDVMYSGRGNIQMGVLYDPTTDKDIADGTIDYLVENYGEYEVCRIEAYSNELVISVAK